MSGGVDSSAAALLLKEEGYRVIGVTMRMWKYEDLYRDACLSGDALPDAAEDAAAVCRALGIEHRILDFRSVFREKVIDYFVNEYRNGRTPNPCIVCNRTVKWEALLVESRRMGAEYIATGHYAGILKNREGRYSILRSDSPKDQSYVLYTLTQEQLAHTLFPLGSRTKEEVRETARSAALPVASKKDSQEICFIPDQDYARFIETYTGIKDEPGAFVDPKGKVLGMHKGITHYTIGQRRGLGLALAEPYYVIKIDPAANEVVLSPADGVFTDTVRVDHVNYMAVPSLKGPVRVLAKIRYSHKPQSAVIDKGEGGTVVCTFDEPVRAATPGQSAVFYRDGCIFCGGTIL